MGDNSLDGHFRLLNTYTGKTIRQSNGWCGYVQLSNYSLWWPHSYHFGIKHTMFSQITILTQSSLYLHKICYNRNCISEYLVRGFGNRSFWEVIWDYKWLLAMRCQSRTVCLYYHSYSENHGALIQLLIMTPAKKSLSK